MDRSAFLLQKVCHLTSGECADLLKALCAKFSLFSMLQKEFWGIKPIAAGEVLWFLAGLCLSSSSLPLRHPPTPACEQTANCSDKLQYTQNIAMQKKWQEGHLLAAPLTLDSVHKTPKVTECLLSERTLFLLVDFLALATLVLCRFVVVHMQCKTKTSSGEEILYSGVFINDNAVRTLFKNTSQSHCSWFHLVAWGA